ncbi:tRNA (adenosine(37)-N6)-threonylcarbamoyltransferase complex dimerization subunit type 1 TsaB [Enemella sp. A6]|uniref:tRNA (adenosine(37)-N6)-threonylcarbamoyltransferase complex dimerization subunit type 1 TsaB n=1 Tax=Enemella sp. A6 TaxID=3440152 RepID=UPI003EBEDFCF
MSEPALTLAIDTSITVAVGIARGDEVLAEQTVDDTRAHVEQLMPSITAAAQRAGVALTELNRVVVGLGPGPFTGLRVGIVTAQTIAAATGAELHGVCTLDALAAQAVAEWDETGEPVPAEFLTTIDARRKELYWARYDASGTRLTDPVVGPPVDLPDVPVLGPGALVYPDLLVSRATGLAPGRLAVLGPRLPAAGTEPLYLRRPDATVSTKRKSTLVSPVRRRRDR